MSEAVEPSDKRGWVPFLEVCGILSTVLSSTRPTLVRAFGPVFEAAIEESRKQDVWNTLTSALTAASAELSFRLPHTHYIFQAPVEEPAPAVNPRVVFDSFARCFATAVVRSRVLPPERSTLAIEFTRCRVAWESAIIEYDVVAPVTGIHTEGFETVAVGEGLGLAWGPHVLTEVSAHQLNTYSSTPMRSGPYTVLVGKRMAGKSDDLNELLKRATAEVTRCVTAMRFATGKIIGCDMLYVHQSADFHQTFNAMRNFIARLTETAVYGDHDVSGPSFGEVEATETGRLIDVLKSEAGRNLEIAIERFNLAMGRQSPEDQVIDLAIALESTICRGGSTEQLSYRFRLFGAAVLADTPGGERAMKILRSLYNARSKVVHAGKRLSELAQGELKAVFPGQSVSQVLDEYRDLARRVLLEFLQQGAAGRSPDQYVHALETAMVQRAKALVREGERAESESPST